MPSPTTRRSRRAKPTASRARADAAGRPGECAGRRSRGVTARGDLVVSATLAIPRHELVVRASRAGGAGGQHVNTSSTRVEVAWDVARSGAITDDERQRLVRALGRRVASDGVLRVVASERRSQAQNREAAEARLADLVRRGLVVPKRRKPTKPTRGSVERRLEAKRRRAERKRERRHDD
ncbi:MAG: aminoacyl-tRNA hydrolase [Gemmatimonadota bacterium]|nr:aminoacyl-tRNA hydrolase [Gemmatimonadota bacterium]